MTEEELKNAMISFIKRKRAFIVDGIRDSKDSDAWKLAFLCGEECILHELEKYVENDFQWDSLLRR